MLSIINAINSIKIKIKIIKNAKKVLTVLDCSCNITIVAIMRMKGGDIVNILKLKGKIVENGFNNLSFAEKIGLPISTFYRRLENDGVDFTIGEIQRIVKVLKLSKYEAIEIFLTSKSQ